MRKQPATATAVHSFMPMCHAWQGMLLLIGFLFALPAVGQVTQNWNSAGVSNDWSVTAPNWDAGDPWVNGNNAVFAGTGETVELASDVTVGNITFDNNGFIIADANNDSLLTLLNPSTITVTTSSHTATISESMAGGAITKAGAGTLILAGANNLTGVVTVSEGRLSLANNGALGGTSAGTVVATNAQLQLEDGVTITGETVNVASGGNDFYGGLSVAADASATWNGTVVMDGGSRLGAHSGGVLTVSGSIVNGAASALNISATGSGEDLGVVVLSGNNTYTGSTNIIRGVLRLGADGVLPATTLLDIDTTTASEDSVFDLAGFDQTIGGLTRTGEGSGSGGSFITNSSTDASTLTVNRATGNTTYSGVIQDGNGVVNLVKTGAGSLTLSGDNTYSGTTTLPATLNNQLVVASNTALGSTAGGTIVGGGSRVVLENGVVVTGENLAITGTGGNNNGALQTVTGAGVSAEWAGNISVSGAEARLGGGEDATLVVSGTISGGPSTAVLFSRGRNATTVLTGISTYSGDTQLFANSGSGATLRIGVDNAISPSSRLSVIATVATVDMNLDLFGHVLTLRGIDTSGNHLSGVNNLYITNSAATPAVLTVSDASSTSVFSGSMVNGTGGLSFVKSGNSTQTLIGQNTYTGSTTVNAGVLQVGGAVSTLGVNGTLASPQIILNGGTFALDNLGASNNNTNRLTNADAVIDFRGGAFLFRGSDQTATNSSEVVDAFALTSRLSTLTTTFGGTNMATVTAGEITRPANGGIALVNGINLGMDGSSTSSIARVFVTTPPVLVGTTPATAAGINSAVHNTQIVPYLLGEAAAVSGGDGTATGVANTFVTYNPATGLRPLNPIDEFTQDSFVAGDNIRLSTTTPTPGSIAINSLILNGASATVSSAHTLTVDSGAILFTNGANLGITGGTLAFGAREGIITINSTSNTTISSIITGTAGVSYYGTGTLVLATQQNQYSGDTGLYVGTVIPQSSSQGPAGAPTTGPFGQGTLILGGSNMRATTANHITIGNDVRLAADTTFITGSTDKTLTFTGDVTIEGGDRTITHNSTANTYFTGVIGDAGQDLGLRVAGSGAGHLVFSGNNTYTGPTTVTGSTLIINGDQSAATGAVTVSGGVLGGSGIIGGATTIRNGGTLNPGDPANGGGIGDLTLASSLTLEAGSVTNLDISNATFTSPDSFGGNSPGSPGYLAYVIANGAGRGDHDQLSIGSTITQETGAKINVLPVNFTPEEGQIFNLLDWAALTGNSFSSNLGDTYRDGSSDGSNDLDLPDISGSGLTWDTSLFTDYGIVVVIPEPSRLLLLGLGLGFGLLRRRRTGCV